MARRKSPEGEAVLYFQEAPLASAVTLFNIAKAILIRRQKSEGERALRSKPAKINHQAQASTSLPLTGEAAR